MVGVSEQVTGYGVSHADVDVVKLCRCGGLDDVALGIGASSRRRVCTLVCANLLRNRQITAAVKGKDFVGPCGGTHSKLRRSYCIRFRNLDCAVKLFLLVLHDECQAVQRVLVSGRRERVVWSVVSGLC